MRKPDRWCLTGLALWSVLITLGCEGGINKFEREVETEAAAVKLSRERLAGAYDLITAAELKKKIDAGDEMLIVDTMPLEESYKNAHVPGAVSFLFDKEVMESWDEAKTGGKSQEDYRALLGEDLDRPIVVYCGFVKCARSHNGAAFAREIGYTNVKRFPGGIYAWKGEGFPTESAE